LSGNDGIVMGFVSIGVVIQKRITLVDRQSAPKFAISSVACLKRILFRNLYCFIIFIHEKREVVHFNVTAHPTAAWLAKGYGSFRNPS
jgi:hypothetical protein